MQINGGEMKEKVGRSRKKKEIDKMIMKQTDEGRTDRVNMKNETIEIE